MDLKNVLEQFQAAHDQLTLAKDQVKVMQEAYDKLRYETVPAALAEAGILDDTGHGSCTTPDGRKVYMSTDTKAYVRAEDREQVNGWLRANGLGELIVEAVHPSTLTSWVRGRLENAEEIPEGVTVYQQDRAGLRKS